MSSAAYDEYQVLVSGPPPVSPARVDAPRRAPITVGAVQQRWRPDAGAHRDALLAGIRLAAEAGAQLVCLQELTLSPYFAISDAPDDVVRARAFAEDPADGPTRTLAAAAAAETGAFVHASLYEAADVPTGGYNTAICVAPDGALTALTRKVHIPVTAGYHEDLFFMPGDTGHPVVRLDLGAAEVGVGFPTCWDQWFPELARAYSLGGAEVIVYPTAIGSEPDHPGFDTKPLWEQVIVGNGIANATFMVAVNRIGTETLGATSVTFYGSSFVSDPYGRVLVQAGRDRPAVIVAELDLDQRSDWLALFPFLRTRRPDTYAGLVQADQNDVGT